MKQIAVSARLPKENKEATVTVNYVDVDGDIDKAYEEAAQVFGKKAVLTNAFANWRVTLQAGIRSALEKGEDLASIQARFSSAKMGVATSGGVVDAEAAFTAKFLSATPAEREKMIAALKAKAAGK
jgi:ssDNA-binding replication factor A large subunit